jgi:hypothetical protein
MKKEETLVWATMGVNKNRPTRVRVSYFAERLYFQSPDA